MQDRGHSKPGAVASRAVITVCYGNYGLRFTVITMPGSETVINEWDIFMNFGLFL